MYADIHATKMLHNLRTVRLVKIFICDVRIWDQPIKNDENVYKWSHGMIVSQPSPFQSRDAHTMWLCMHA